jgi:hypothetical protein
MGKINMNKTFGVESLDKIIHDDDDLFFMLLTYLHQGFQIDIFSNKISYVLRISYLCTLSSTVQE